MDVKVLINALVELAGLEAELEEARQLLARNRECGAGLDDLQVEYRQDAEEAQQAGTNAAAHLRRCEHEIQAIEQKLADRRRRRGGLADVRQVAAIEQEITVLKEQLDAHETRALELLDELGAGSRVAADARRECDEQDERRRRQQLEMRAKSLQAAAAEEELVGEIERVVALLPDPVARHVRRLRQGRERSVVYVESGACGGCFAQLPAQQGIAAEHGTSVIQCASCASYVVHRPWR